MTVRITHTKVSGKPAGSDPDRVYGTHWDADHTVTGLDIGTDVQAYDADLAALAANSTNGLWARTASGEGAARTITGTAAEVTVTNGDGVSGNPTLSLPSTLTLTGKTVTVATQTARDNSTKAASTAYVDTATREKLTADRTYYVRTDGSNSNTGLANTSGGAFLTLQKAANVAMAIDLSIYDVTINVAAGTYSENLSLGRLTGGGSAIFVGDTTTPSNVVFNRVTVTASGWQMKGFKTNSTSGNHILVDGVTVFDYYQWDFGSAGVYSHVLAQNFGLARFNAAYTISGSAGAHWQTAYYGMIYRNTVTTITLTGTPAITYFAASISFGNMVVNAQTFSGSATGTRYSAQRFSVIDTNGGGASYLPGDSAGSVDALSTYA